MLYAAHMSFLNDNWRFAPGSIDNSCCVSVTNPILLAKVNSLSLYIYASGIILFSLNCSTTKKKEREREELNYKEK